MKILQSIVAVAFLSSSLAFAGPTPAKSLRCADNEMEGGLVSFNIESTKKFFEERGSQDVTWLDVDFTFAGKKIGTSLYQPWASTQGGIDFYQAQQPKNFKWICGWEKCPIKDVKLNLHSSENNIAKGTVSFTYAPNGLAGWLVEHSYPVTCAY